MLNGKISMVKRHRCTSTDKTIPVYWRNEQASIIWIIGEYAERIDNADEQLEHFLETFEEESSEVQLQLLTATVKLFLKQPEDTQVKEKREGEE